MGYIRFVVGTESDSPRSQTGLFTELKYLLEEDVLQPYQQELVQEVFDYFNKELPIPPYSGNKWSKDAIAWFKDDASPFIDRMRDLAFVVEEYGLQVRILLTDKPGMILYEDEFQVVAQNRIY